MRAVGIILAGGSNEKRLGDLTNSRATSAMPVGSCYRAIDFALSNMSNSGVNKVAVITQYNSRSLHDHLTSSKWWNFGRKQGGLFVFTPYLTNDNSLWFRGTAEAIYQNLAYLKKSNEPYVIISSGDGICKIDYRKIIQYHVEKNADITVIYKKIENKDLSRFGVLELDSSNRITSFEEKPIEATTNNASIGIYVISRTLLISVLEEIINDGRYDFVKDVIVRYVKKFNIYGYEFHDYWNTISLSVLDYFNTNMDFLRKDVRDVFLRHLPNIETKPKDEPPVKYVQGCHVSDAIIGSGSILNGRVEHSVLFRRVFTAENSVVKNSIVMDGCYIGNNCVVENAILDKEIVLSDGKQIIGTPDAPIIIKKGSVI